VKAPAEVVAYDPRWPEWFEVIRAALTSYLAGVPHQVEHVGSTAVLGIAAKPVRRTEALVGAPPDDRSCFLRLRQVGAGGGDAG
jgi:GrpB-like predicted nucleotidyltransferase (UPF0157 family)